MEGATRIRLGWFLVIAGLIVVPFSILAGMVMDGWDTPDVQCAVSGNPPALGGPYLEDARVTGKWTQLPLGIDCTFDSPIDAYGPQTVSNPDWVATTTFVVAIASVIGGFVLVAKGHAKVRAEQAERRAATRRRLGMNDTVGGP